MKLSIELIEAYLDGSLNLGEAAKLKLWLKEHPADQARVQRQQQLRDLLAGSAVEPSAAQSRRMWANIKARVKAEAAPAPVLDLGEPWYAFIFKPWGGALSAGLATAAMLALALVWRPWQVAPLESPAGPVEEQAAPEKLESLTSQDQAALAKASAGASRGADRAPSRRREGAGEAESGFAPSMDEAAAAAPAAAAPRTYAKAAAKASSRAEDDSLASAEPTEVERALADSDVDGMIDAQLAAVRQAPARPSYERRGLSTPYVGLSGLSAPSAAVADSRAMNAAQGGRDSNGFWDWRPAAMAMNRRDWPQVRLELDAARANAAESVERSFAGSALTLLSAPGAPLAGQQAQPLPAIGELRVLGAGRWQLISDSRLARFSEGVSARLPGFRSEGDSLLLDLTFDRGTFSPGTRFTRVAGDAPAEVLDAHGQALSADEFSAPTGATYNVSGRQLKLR